MTKKANVNQKVVNIPSTITNSTYQSLGIGNRQEMLKYVPTQASRVLEVGCGYGNFGELLKKNYEMEVWAIELNQKAAEIAKQKLDKVICDDFSQAKTLDLPHKYFDCIIFNDVLEHMIDPYSILIESKDLLTSEGIIIASIPNVRYLSNVYNFLIRQDWEYQDYGILDRTHLRFFTQKSMQKMFVELGYKIDLIEGINSIYSRSPFKWNRKKRLLLKLIFTSFNLIFFQGISDMQYQQFAIVTRPNITN
jgi:2-polyprenyl-3-methyl-5-hydroxy-6-metoxy-1,4-benzoquinol methylase